MGKGEKKIHKKKIFELNAPARDCVVETLPIEKATKEGISQEDKGKFSGLGFSGRVWIGLL